MLVGARPPQRWVPALSNTVSVTASPPPGQEGAVLTVLPLGPIFPGEPWTKEKERFSAASLSWSPGQPDPCSQHSLCLL